MNRISYSLLFILITIGCIDCVFAQEKEEFILEQKKFILNDGKHTIYSQFTSKRRKIDDFKYYNWFDAGDVKITLGGYSGKLLHGTYSKYYYPNKALCEQGEFRYGLKEGKWKKWYPSGEYQEIMNWRSGYRHGKFIVFNEHGKVIEKGIYKMNELHGEIQKTQGDSIVTVRYKRGREIKIEQPNIHKNKREKKK